jgi:hypothetical protein
VTDKWGCTHIRTLPRKPRTNKVGKQKIASSAAPALRGVWDVFDPKFCPLNNLSIVESVSLLIKKFDPLVFKELRASVSLLRKSKEIKIKSANKEINKEIAQDRRPSGISFPMSRSGVIRPRQEPRPPWT